MPRTHDWVVQPQVAMGHDWVTAIPFIGSSDLCAARNRHSMVMRRSAFRNHQIVHPLYFVKVRCLCMNPLLEGSIPESIRVSDKAHGLQVQFLQPNLPMSFKLSLEGYAVANVPGASIVV